MPKHPQHLFFITGVSTGLGREFCESSTRRRSPDAVRFVKEKLTLFADEVDTWEKVSKSTDFA